MNDFPILPRNKTNIVLKGYHWSQQHLDSIQDDEIFFLSLNMTSQCNYRCPYCFIGHKNLVRSSDELGRDDKLRILKQGKEMGAGVVVMPGKGEPLADPDFFYIVEQAATLGLYVVVDTNIFFLDKKKIKLLESLPISLFVKVDTLNPIAYELSVGAKNVYSKFRENLDDLITFFHKPHTEESGRIISRLGINAVITTINAPYLDELRDWCETRDVYFTCRTPVCVGQAQPNWEYLMGEQTLQLKTLGLNYSKNDFTSTTEGGHCGIYRFGITVENNGDIYVCPQARTPIGNLQESTLKEIILLRNGKGLLNKEAGYCFAKDQFNQEGAFTKSNREKQIDFKQ